MLKVCEKKCSECLFSENKIVSDLRRNEIVRKLKRKDTYFHCHKGSLRSETWVCRGSFEMMPQMVRIAGRLGALQFIDPENPPKEP